MIPRLQENHAQTSESGGGSVSTDLEVSKADTGVDGSGTTAGGGRGRGARAGVSSSSSLGGDSTGTSSASLLDLRGASASGRGGGLGAGRATEAASSSSLVLLGVVLVQGESELILDTAHAVGTVLAGGGVGIEATTVSVTTDNTQELSELGAGQAAVSNASRGIVNTVAKVLIGGRGKRRRLGLPVGVLGRAGLKNSVGRGVRGLVGAGRAGSGNLLGVVGEVSQLANAGAIDNRNKT